MNRKCPMNGRKPPFSLPSNVVYFFDWRYVDHGYLHWLDPDDKSVGLMPVSDCVPPMHADAGELPRGIRIETVPGTVDTEPVLRAAEMGERLFFGGSVVREDSVYRLFYESIRPNFRNAGHDKVLRYAESDDGLEWRFPQLGNAELDGNRPNNVVMDPGRIGYHGGSVFVDPNGRADQRYKALWFGFVSREELEKYQRRQPNEVDPKALIADPEEEARAAYGLRGAVSPDGLRWSLLPEPLLVQFSDTFNAAAWDPIWGCYVTYPRTWYYDRRSVGRAVSDDFRTFGGLVQVLWPDPGMRPTDTWYTPGYTTVPGAPDYRLLFATLWSQVDDTFRPMLHTSPDGLLWQRVPGAQMLPFGAPGSWHACGGAIPTLVELPGDQWGSLFMGWHVPHKHPRPFPFGQGGWVRWQRGRLAALRADADARFRLYPVKIRGRRIVLNCRTNGAGWIRVGVRGRPDRRIEACDRITGDHLDRVVTWDGRFDIGEAETVQLEFEMRACDLYNVRFE